MSSNSGPSNNPNPLPESNTNKIPKPRATDCRNAPRKRVRSMQNLGRVEMDTSPVFSCSHINCVNGKLIAHAFVTPKFVVPSSRNDFISVYRSDYEPKRITSCGDKNKPLVKYDPNAQRNRLRQDKLVMLSRNKSSVGTSAEYARRFVTTNQNVYRGETGIQSQNRSIVASKVKFYHSMQAR